VRPTRAEVDTEAIRANVETLVQHAAPAEVLAVVKADGYGHGAPEVAAAAVAGGATWLGVALVEEGAQLREAGRAEPILVLSEPHRESLTDLVAHGLVATVYHADFIDDLAAAASEAGVVARVHLKVDTGMNRVGAPPETAVMLARRVADLAGLDLEGVYTHLAVADAPENAYTDHQLDRFDAVLAELDDAGLRPPLVHSANSAAAIAHERSRRSLVRCGIAIYGISPSAELDGFIPLQPAMRLVSEVSLVKRVPAGTRVSYGLTYETSAETTLATVPIGYADGVPRGLADAGAEVLVGGHRQPIAGVVTMDQLVIDCGDQPVERGDQVVLLGRQGREQIRVEEWAELLGTIGYEVVCGIGSRVPRRY
jgi:alanine racemase